MTNTATTGHNIYCQHTSREGLVHGAWAPDQTGHKVSKRDWFVIGEIRRYATPMRWTWKCRVRGCSTPNEFCTETGTGYKRQYDAWLALMAHVQHREV